MRELYLEEKEVKRLLNPPMRTRGLLSLNHPERLLSPSTKFYKYPEGYVRQPLDERLATFVVTPIKCNLILTDYYHTGFWLLGGEMGKVSMLEKNMEEEELYEIEHGESISPVYRTILKLLIKANPAIDPLLYATDDALISRIGFFLKTYYRLEVLSANFPIYYSFYSKDYENELNLYVIIEVDKPAYPNNEFDHELECLTWYNRTDHQVYRKFHKTKVNSPDIRTHPKGREKLDKILRTEELFGKLNIY